MLATQINNTLTQFTEAFNANDLDRVMTFVSDDAVYQTGDGKTHSGKAAIRAELEPQFSNALGTMHFDELDFVIDAEHCKAASRWVCRHDIRHAKPRGVAMSLQRILIGLTLGNRFGWEGVDIFHLNAEGMITAIFTYGWWRGTHPRIKRALG